MEIQFDVIVIGAGINGAGIAREAARRGLTVLLIDKGDVGGGTSSWSTRLIHGGLRYLEHGEFGLVRESLRERERLLKIAPHLVRVIPILVPIYEKARRGRLTIRAGMIAYDLLSYDKSMPRHRMLTRDETLERAPGLNRSGLLGAAVYFDAQVEFAERLVVENALSAIEHGATVVTYAKVDRFLIEDGKVCGVEFIKAVQRPMSNVQSQLITGTAGVSPADDGSNSIVYRLSVRAKIVINAAGPWVDELLRQAGAAWVNKSGPPAHAGGSDKTAPRLIGGTKGSHLIVKRSGGAPDTAIYVEAETDGRPFFIIPWNGNYLIGTTDIRYDGDLDRVQIEDDEVEYLLRESNRVIQDANLTRESILYTYSGVRPLPFAGERDEPSITRRHFIRAHPSFDNLFSIVGGKLTTYRSLAEEAVDVFCKQLGQTAKQQSTRNETLPGAAAPDFEAFSKNFKLNCGFPERVADRWLRVYGTRSSSLVDLIKSDATLAEVFDRETGAVAAEIVFAFRQEFAETLTDCLLRRTMVGLNSSCGLDGLEKAAGLAQKLLGWSDERVAQELDAYWREVNKRRLPASREAQEV